MARTKPNSLLMAVVAAWSMDQMQRDVGAMMEALLLKTLPQQGEKREGERK